MQRTLLLLCVLILAACKSDNAAPETHGAHNKPSDVSSGETKSSAPPANAQDTAATTQTTPPTERKTH